MAIPFTIVATWHCWNGCERGSGQASIGRARSPCPSPGTGAARTPSLSLRPAGLVEAETRIADIQALARRIRAKSRDLRLEKVVLLVADTRHNRQVISLHPELRASFPLTSRACLAALGAGRQQEADALVIL